MAERHKHGKIYPPFSDRGNTAAKHPLSQVLYLETRSVWKLDFRKANSPAIASGNEWR